jgi:hypothetical protein
VVGRWMARGAWRDERRWGVHMLREATGANMLRCSCIGLHRGVCSGGPCSLCVRRRRGAAGAGEVVQYKNQTASTQCTIENHTRRPTAQGPSGSSAAGKERAAPGRDFWAPWPCSRWIRLTVTSLEARVARAERVCMSRARETGCGHRTRAAAATSFTAARGSCCSRPLGEAAAAVLKR